MKKIGSQKLLRRMLVEHLTERIALHAGEMVEEESTLVITTDGLAYYYDPVAPSATESDNDPVDEMTTAFVDETSVDETSVYVTGEPQLSEPQLGEPGGSGAFQSQLPPGKLDVPIYHSDPSSSKKIYLDFDGQMVSNTYWNNRVFNGANNYNTGAVINAPAFSLDGDLTTFSAGELVLIQDVWARVAEDYAPFQVDVTTEEPPAELFTAGNQAMRVLVTTSFDATTGAEWFPAAGGVAFLRSWYATNGTPCFVFGNYMYGYSKYFADAASHEVGHTFGLQHDGRVTPPEEYYAGHGSGATAWGPIMGPGYYANLNQWSNGDYPSATNTEDDLEIISAGAPYKVDDHGNTQATATLLNVGTASTLATSGLITTRTDVDAIRFATQAGSITLNVDPFDYATTKANLDAKMTLLKSDGSVVMAVDNIDTINSTMTVTVPKGFYTLLVDGSGRPAIGTDYGYSDYASIGRYTVSGSIVANAAPTVTNDTATVAASGSVLIDVLGNDTDANNDILTLASVGSPALGVVAIESGKIRYTASSTTGQVVFAYTVVDELGVSSTGNVTVTVVTSPPTLGAVVVGDGTSQRSMIQQVTVTINGAVSIGSGAFTLIKRGPDGGAVTATAAPVFSAGQTVVTLTFSGGYTRGGGILSDGYYQLTIDGSKITQSGQGLDANNDGQGGDSYSIGANEADNFFSLYADTNGDGIVGVAEFGQFRSAFGKLASQSGFDNRFDYEGDGVVGVSDFGQFRSRFGKAKPAFV